MDSHKKLNSDHQQLIQQQCSCARKVGGIQSSVYISYGILSFPTTQLPSILILMPMLSFTFTSYSDS